MALNGDNVLLHHSHCIADVRPVATWAIVIGVASMPCLFIGPSFQYAKFYNTRSGEGVSALTLAIGSLARGLVVVNLIILHYDQMMTCYHSEKPPSFVDCQSSFLVLYSGILGFFAYFPQFLVLVTLIDQKKEPEYYNQAKWGGVLVSLILLAVFLPVSAAIEGKSCFAAEGYAVTIGYISTFFLCLQFTPQLYTSLIHKSAGSMSYITYGLDVIGGVIILQAKLYGTREDMSTWLPTLIMHCFEAVIVVINMYHDYYKGNLEGSLLSECYFLPKKWQMKGSPKESTPLLQNMEDSQANAVTSTLNTTGRSGRSTRSKSPTSGRPYAVHDDEMPDMAPGWGIPLSPHHEAKNPTIAWGLAPQRNSELQVEIIPQRLSVLSRSASFTSFEGMPSDPRCTSPEFSAIVSPELSDQDL